MRARLTDEREDEAADARFERAAACGGLLQRCVEQLERMAHAGQKQRVLVAEIFIDDADAHARARCDRGDGRRLKAAAGKFRDPGLQNCGQRGLVQFSIHKTPLQDVNISSRLIIDLPEIRVNPQKNFSRINKNAAPCLTQPRGRCQRRRKLADISRVRLVKLRVKEIKTRFPE